MKVKKTKYFVRMFLLIVIVCAIVSLSWGAGHEVYDVVVKRLGQTTQIVINGNGPFNYKDFVLDNPTRIVIDCIGSEHNLPGPRTYVLERGGVVAIRSSYIGEPTPKVRLIVDLKERFPYVVFKEGKNLIIALDAVAAEPFAQWQASKFYEHRRPPRTEAFFYSKGRDVISEPYTIPGAEIETAELYTPVEMEPKKEEKLIDVEYENADLVKVIRSFASWTNQNIVISPGVSGNVSVSLRDVPVRTALDIILKINDFAIVEEPGDIWRITTIEEIHDAQIAIQNRADSLEQVIPLVTEVLGIEYARASDIIGSVSPSDRGNITIDERTNSLIVTDTPTSIERTQDMIARLDTPTSQVNIEAQIIEIGNDISRELGIQWGANIEDTTGVLLFIDLSERLTNELSDFLSGDETTETKVTLSAILSALELEDKAHVISRPNITVLNHKQATINSGNQVPTITRDEAGNMITTFVPTGIQLSVTPHVNPNDRITLEVNADVSTAQSSGTGAETIFTINTKNAATIVMVDNGATAVIGGLITNDEAISEARIPFLSKLPIIGRLLFTNKNKRRNSREVLILITPTILSDPPTVLY